MSSPTLSAPLAGAKTPKNGAPLSSWPEPPMAKDKWNVELLPVERIDPNPYQPRTSFDHEEMEELVASVRAQGVQQPIIVRTVKPEPAKEADGKASKNALSNNSASKLVRYTLIAGERRLRASKVAGRKQIPAIIRDDLSEREAAELALVENVQRSNLNPIEEAQAYKRLMLDFRMTEERIAKKVGKSVASIRESIKLLQLPESVRRLIANKQLTPSHGHELLPLASFERVCTLVAHHVVTNHQTVTALRMSPLPNARELQRQNLLVELGWQTKFDWKAQCEQCPFKAFVKSGYSAFCLKPEEWHQKQKTAIALKEQEAIRVLEEAREQGESKVEVAKLERGAYRDLSFQVPPAGCTASCPCRSEGCDPTNPTRKMPICLDPKRYEELMRAERQAREEERRRLYLRTWQDAKDVLCAEGNERKTAALLALPVLRAEFTRYVDGESWQALARSTAANLHIVMPWDEVFEGDFSPLPALKALEEVEPQKLLLLCGALRLAYEADHAIRFVDNTPLLDYVLGREPVEQAELSPQGDENGDEEAPDEWEGYPELEEDESEPVSNESETGSGFEETEEVTS